MIPKIQLSSDRCFLIGMVHLGPIFEGRGMPPLEDVEQQAVEEALVLADAGFDAIMIENLGDAPYYPDQVPPHTIAGMTRIAMSIQAAFKGKKNPPSIGINVMRNDSMGAIAICAAAGGSFIRTNVHTGVMVTDQGIIHGKAHLSSRYRDQFHPNCSIFADVRVKHAAPLAERPLKQEAIELWKRGRADAIILTGAQTGDVIVPHELRGLRQALPHCPLIAGSGVTPEQMSQLLPYIEGIIVGTWLKEDGDVGNPISSERANHFVKAVRSYEKNR
ncbi:MAG: BtpA/SgcQ family protein [Deltaproteobacteria bacterium]|nr:MAG: BtpA/SgcQ family protein [Deltaproteobacteria bacterium]